jgi:uncharacterized membrane protein
MTHSDILWFIVGLVVVAALFPNLGIARGYRHPVYVGPSLWSIAILLILLRVFHVI